MYADKPFFIIPTTSTNQNADKNDLIFFLIL